MAQQNKDSDFDDLDSTSSVNNDIQAADIEQTQVQETYSEQMQTQNTEYDIQDNQQHMDYPAWVDTFQRWLGEGNAQDVRNIMDFFDRSHARFEAVKELTTDEFAQKSQYLKRDLMMFFNHYQADMAESEFVQAVKESAWHELAEMTDRAQIEWQELEQDFRHEGVYHQGEWVGMGVIVCRNCHYKLTFVHPEQLTACPECNHDSFLREALAP